ncbi:MAG: hypothetical protein HOP31_08980 [Ignavibacteria bacterium]|nr:hypothetical protein [Ignavibacteria bacterium]
MRTAHLPGNAAGDNRLVNQYGRKTSDNTKTVYRQSLEKIAKSDLMNKPIPLSELDKYTNHDLEIYIAEHEQKETVIQEELISKETEFADKVRADIAKCRIPADYTHLLHKYSELQFNPGFRKDVISHAKNTVIKDSGTESDLVDVWNIFKSLAVVEDPEDLLVTAIKQRRSEINKLTL